MQQQQQSSTDTPQPTRTGPLTVRAPRARCSGLGGRMPTMHLADLVDLGFGGIGLQTTELPRLRHPYRVDLGAPDLTFEGRVIWTRFVEAVPDTAGQVQAIYRCGLQFSDLERVRAKIERFLASAGAQALPGMRGTPRFRLADSMPRLLLTSFPFHVLTISRSGMLVAIDHLPDANTPVELLVELPGGDLQLKGRVVDVFQNIDPSGLRTRVAFTFLEPPVPALSRLDSFVASQAARGLVH